MVDSDLSALPSRPEVSLKRSTRRARFYRAMLNFILEPGLLPWVVKKDRLKRGKEDGALLRSIFPSSKKRLRIWFHAASVGELETLWPIVLDLAENPEFEGVLTVFSASARERVARLAHLCSQKPGRVLFAGYSPWEGRWGQALDRVAPSLFVTTKYEAWPELWVSLSERDLPLVVVGAKARRSLAVCARICRVLGTRLPRLHLLATNRNDYEGLQGFISGAFAEVAGEPRWDQVFARSKTGNLRAKEIYAFLKDLPRPWGVLGSAWESDLELWEPFVSHPGGTRFIVPHRIDGAHLEPMFETLKRSGRKLLRTSTLSRPIVSGASTEEVWVVVDEMGFLSELYSFADWAYVGGGFGDGVHSTIEPAIQGIPIVCGPHRASQFPEIEELLSSGQLTIVRARAELGEWIRSLGSLRPEEKDQWRAQAKARTGSTRRISELLQSVASRS